MSASSILRADQAATPAPDGGRVAAIRNTLSLDDADSIAAFGERPRRDILACLEQIAGGAETDLDDCADAVGHLRRRLAELDPAQLAAPAGLAGLFSTRGGRLERFRDRFVDTVRALASAGGDLKARLARLDGRGQSLNAAHEQLRAAIHELDAHIEAGRARLEGEAEADDPASPQVRLATRLGALTGLRAAALSQLPVVRMAQNADAYAAEAAAAGLKATIIWRDEWGEALGMDRRRRIRPDTVWLGQARQDADEALARAEIALGAARARRTEAETRLRSAAEAARALA